jgi:hypothetical protein
MRTAAFLRVALGAGVLAGLACFGYFLVLYRTVPSPLSGKKEPGVVLVWLGMVLAVRYYRRHGNRGELHFWEAMGLALLTALVAGLTDGALLAGFLEYVDAAPLRTLIAEGQQLVRTGQEFNQKNFKNDPESLLNHQKLLESLASVSPLTIFKDDVLKKLLLSAFPAALIAVYFRRMSRA